MNRSSERGSALLLSILAIAALGAGLMGVLTLSGIERRAVLDQQARTEALGVAESGLERFIGERAALGFTASPAAAYESTRVNVDGGYADVVLRQLRPSVGTAPATYVIRSRGLSTSARLTGVPASERTITSLAQWQSSAMRTLAAVTGLAGITKTNSNGTISGSDQCLAATTVGGAAVPAAGYTQDGAWMPAGNPAVRYLGPAATAHDSAGVDWAGIVAGTSVVADIQLPGGTWPSFASSTYWPVIRVTGDFTLPSSGRGVLMVTGSLTIGTNGRNWDGIILVGNQLIVSANTTVQGAVVAGLNRKLGGSPAASTIASGGAKIFRYNSCNIATALSTYGGLVVLPDTWTDNN